MDVTLSPVEIDVRRSEYVRIRWADGVESVLPVALLRRECPCAVCRAVREDAAKNPLRVIRPGEPLSDQVTIENAELVGRYALRLRWRDGHDTGLYEFRALRALGSGGR
jgi:DUF971 family protein